MIYKLMIHDKPGQLFETNSSAHAHTAFERAYCAGLRCVLYVDGVAAMRSNGTGETNDEN